MSETCIEIYEYWHDVYILKLFYHLMLVQNVELLISTS